MRLVPTLATFTLLLLDASSPVLAGAYLSEASALVLAGRAWKGHSVPSIPNKRGQPTTEGTEEAVANDPDKGGGTSTSQQNEQQQQQQQPTETVPCSMLMEDVRQPDESGSAVNTKSTVAYSHMSAGATLTVAATGSASATVAQETVTASSIVSRDAEGAPSVSRTVAPEAVTASSIVSVPDPVPDGLRSFLSKILAEPTVPTTSTSTSIFSRDVEGTPSVSGAYSNGATASDYGETTSPTPPRPTTTTATRAAKMSNDKPPVPGPPPPKNLSPASSRPTDDDDQPAASASGSTWSMSMSDLPPLLRWIECIIILLTGVKDVIKYVWGYVRSHCSGKRDSRRKHMMTLKSCANLLEEPSSSFKKKNRVQMPPV